AWPQLGDSYRVTIPSRLYDPKVGADLYHRYLDEWALCDELGINIMTSEHHATAACADAVCTFPMAILARETKKVRLLALGMPIGNRNDPIRVAEEYSILDVISRGRIEMGFVKGVPFEISPANTNPADLVDRFWEAHDLILKAMTTHDGPFNWEGTHFHYRSVNVWPRPYQEPHPPVWMPVGSTGSAAEAAERATRVQRKDGTPINPRTMSVEDAIDAGLSFAGTPDDVFDQLKAFYNHVGGFAHLLMMGQGGYISHEDTVDNLTLFSREVLP